MITVGFQWGDGDGDPSDISKTKGPRPGPMDAADFSAMHDGRSQDLAIYNPDTTAIMLMDLARQHIPSEVWRANMDGPIQGATPDVRKVKTIPVFPPTPPSTTEAKPPTSAQDQPVPNANPSPTQPITKIALDPPADPAPDAEPDPGPRTRATARPTARPSTRPATRQRFDTTDATDTPSQPYTWPERSGLTMEPRKSIFQRIVDSFSGGQGSNIPDNSFIGSGGSHFFNEGDMGNPNGGDGIQWSDGTITDLGVR